MDLPLSVALHPGPPVGEQVVVTKKTPFYIEVLQRRLGPGEVLHLRGELRMGAGRVRLWCVCGFKWDGDTKDADAAWEGHLQ